MASVTDTMKCSVCLEFLSPPIRLCVEGHTICGDCVESNKITRCPECRSPMAGAKRVIQLEQLIEGVKKQMKVSCSFSTKGCTYVVPVNELEAHESECRNRTFRCEGATFCNWKCGWIGDFGGMLQHFQKDHGEHSHMQYTTKSAMKINFDADFKDIQIISFLDGKQLFWYKHKLDVKEKKGYWMFQFVGPKKQAAFYEYEFEVTCGSIKKFKVNDFCVNDRTDVEELFREERAVVMSFQQMKNFVNADGELQFRFRIKNVRVDDRH